MHSFRTRPPDSDTDRFRLADNDGQLALFTVRGFEEGVSTVHGSKDAARVDVTVLTGPAAGTSYDDQLLFAQVVRQQLAEAVQDSDDNVVLARIGTGTPKAGQKPPWLLLAPSREDEGLAAQHVAQRPSPAPAASKPAAGGWSSRAPF